MRDRTTYALGAVLASLLLIGLGMPLAGAAQPPSKPNFFTGKVLVNGEPFPEGTLVVAKYRGSQIENTRTLANGTYWLQISPRYPTVEFYVRGVDTGESAEVVSGELTEMDLTLTDDTSPSLSASFEGSSPTSRTSVMVSGTVSDDLAFSDEISVTIAGSEITPSPDGTFSEKVSLESGTNDIEVTASDFAGNSTSETLTVVSDTEAPTISVTAPSLVGEKTATIEGKVEDAVASAQELDVRIDGALVELEDDGSFSKEVSLTTGSNGFTVQAKDAVDHSSSRSVEIVSDPTAPTVSITSPADGKVVKESTVTIEGIVSDEVATYAELEATLNGEPVPITGDGTFSKEVTIEQGSNTMTVEASDPAGNSSSDEVTVVRDAERPSVTVDSPAEGLVTTKAIVTVSGSVDDDVTNAQDVDLTVEGNAVSVGSDGSYSTEVSLQEGSNTINVAVTDGVGRTASKTVTVTSDRTAPSLTVDAPEDGAVVTESAVTVEGNVDDEITKAGEITLTIDGESADVNSDGSFSKSVSLDKGSNTISLEATDGVGKTTSDEVTVTYDAESPTLTLTSPEKKLTTENDTIEFKGTVSDDVTEPQEIEVTVGGNVVEVNSDGSFSKKVSLSMGTQTITVKAEDGVGKTTTKTRTPERVSGTPWALYIGVAVVIAIVLAGAAIWRRRARPSGGGM